MNKEDIEKIIEMTINKYDKKYISLKKDFGELLSDYIELSREEARKEKALLDIKEIFDKHTSTNELGTKYLITSTKEDKELLDIVNKALEGNNE